jgi:hypothetical protein
MCCTLLVFGWSITIFFRTCVFAIKFGGMICPAFAHSGIPILLLLCSVLYTHWGQCVIQVWGMEEQNTIQYFAMLSLRIWLNLNPDLYFIGELNMMNT